MGELVEKVEGGCDLELKFSGSTSADTVDRVSEAEVGLAPATAVASASATEIESSAADRKPATPMKMTRGRYSSRYDGIYESDGSRRADGAPGRLRRGRKATPMTAAPKDGLSTTAAHIAAQDGR
jgi:hypothetical protein